jgi:tetratricopeptide (TPR) repeat protein
MMNRSHICTAMAAEAPARRPPRRAVAWALALCVSLLGSLAGPAAADPIKADVTVSTSGGYARIVFRFSDDVDADVRLANSVLVIDFKTPVDVSVDRLYSTATGYVNAARRDPDGKAVRMALARKVAVNSMMAGERLFVDLLPTTWSGPPPGLPQEVVEELAKRARDAERKEREQRALARQRQVPLIPVRVGRQPTFTRYVFELPELTAVAAERDKDQLKLVFDAQLKFDLASAKASLPPIVEAIDAESGEQSATVSFSFIGKVDVRSFREDNNFVLDVAPTGGARSRADLIPPAAAVTEPPAQAVPPPPVGNLAPPQTISAQPPPADAGAPSPPAAPPVPVAPAAAPAAVPEAAKALPPVAEPAPPDTAPKPRQVNAPVAVELRRQGDKLKLTFPFTAPTPAAVFRRAETLWLVFDTDTSIDLSALENEPSRTIRDVSVTRSRNGQVVRLALERPRLTSVAAEDTFWTVTVGDVALEPTQPLDINRSISANSIATIPFDDPRTLHRLTDPDAGDTLLVVTALGPARGFLKTLEFVDFRALASTQGVVIEPLADDIAVDLSADKIVVRRPGGLSLSAGGASARRVGAGRAIALDPQLWGFDRQADFAKRQFKLVTAAASAPETKRTGPRLDLARFYLARDMYPEAKAVLDVALADERPSAENSSGLVLRAVANLMLGRADDALKDLANPLVSGHSDAQLWRAAALAAQGKWAEAHAAFRGVATAVGALPIELQRLLLKDALQASIEVRDVAAAANEVNDLETIGVPPDLEPTLSVLKGRLAEALGRNADALGDYRAAAESVDRPAAAQGRLREIVLRYQIGDLKRADAVSELETLTTIWRGDETEAEALQLLARLYTQDARYRDAFYVMRTALRAHPNSEMTRRIQAEAATTFDALFLAGKGDAMPAIDALSLFYDFRELTPIGRRGDEMIRRLSDRLVSVDLLDQACELLQHQVDHRLQGAARAQVATRLAVIYLMNHKPDAALAVLRTTRTAGLSNEMRDQRRLIEARALSDIGRHDLALDVVANVQGREAMRLRSDILWAAKRWREAAEQIELLYGERWRDWQPLNEAERGDILRAALGYALAEDHLGLDRFSGKYAAKMAEGPDRRAFEIVTAPASASTDEFRQVARALGSINTLEAFLRDLRARYPETGSFTPVDAAFGPGSTPQSRAPQAEPRTTGAVPAPPISRQAAR